MCFNSKTFLSLIPGYFSLINDKGAPTATLYTTITKLVREKVYKFLSVDNLTAYTESQSSGEFSFDSKIIKFYVVSTSGKGTIS